MCLSDSRITLSVCVWVCELFWGVYYEYFMQCIFSKNVLLPSSFLNHQIPWPNWIIAQSIQDNKFYSNYAIYTAL